MLINCGGVPNVRGLLFTASTGDEDGVAPWGGLPHDAQVYIIDSHRPYHHTNIRGDNVTILDYDDDAHNSELVPFDGDSEFGDDDDDDEDADEAAAATEEDAARRRRRGRGRSGNSGQDGDNEGEGGDGEEEEGGAAGTGGNASKRRRLRRVGGGATDSPSSGRVGGEDSEGSDGEGGRRVVGPMDAMVRDQRAARRRYKAYYTGQSYGRPASFVMYDIAEQVRRGRRTCVVRAMTGLHVLVLACLQAD